MSTASLPFLLIYIDDNEADIELLREALGAVSPTIEVVAFTEAAAALAAMTTMACPDMVISDLHMPYLGGPDLIDIIGRSAWASVPLVLVSGAEEAHVRVSLGARAERVRCLRKGTSWEDQMVVAEAIHAQLRATRQG